MSDKNTHRIVSTKAIGTEVAEGVKESKKAKKENRRVAVTAPPPPPLKLGEVANPIIGNRGLKRALAVAIVKACTHGGKVDEEKAAAMIRSSGILFKSGWDKEKPTDALAGNEWSGKSYVRFATSTAEGKAYPEKHKEKVIPCVPFARALKEAVDVAQDKAAEKEAVAAK
jgi:hypothetical protein